MSWVALKDTARERRIFQNRALLALILVVVLLAVLVVRLYYLQVVRHEAYTTLSESNRVQVQSIPPPRGRIFDRNGVLLADNRPIFSVTVVPERAGELDELLTRLRGIIEIQPEEEERFRRRLREHRRPHEAIPLRYQLSEEDIARLAVHRHELQGVDVSAEMVRDYPFAEYTAHALGYVGRINEKEMVELDKANYSGTHYIGKLAVEKFYEDRLHGRVGVQNVETNARGRVMRVLERTEPVPGEDLILNLDIRLQKLAHDVMGTRRGGIVAIDVRDGGILALASTPSYNANLFVTGISQANYKALRDSIDVPLFNRATRGQYPPGSTIKPMMIVAGLDSGFIHRNTAIWDPGFYQIKGSGRFFRDWKKTGHGRVDLFAAIAESCDTFFYDMGFNMGVDNMSRYLAMFGFGEVVAVDVGDALPGVLPTREWKRAVKRQAWYPGDSINMSIGQGYMLATPLQLAAATSVMASRGVWRAPRMLRGTRQGDVDLPPVRPKGHEDIQLSRPEYWDWSIEGMVQVMHGSRGTARAAAKGMSYKMAGKTGTAQVVGIPQGEKYNAARLAERFHDHALFVGFAPADDPQIAVAVMVENGGSGSGTAAPIARQIMDAWIDGFPEESNAPEGESP